VQLSRLGAHRRQPYTGQLRGHGPTRLSSEFQRTLSDIFPSHGVQARRQGRSFHIRDSHPGTQLYHEPHSGVWPAASTDADEGVSAASATHHTPSVVQEVDFTDDSGHSPTQLFQHYVASFVDFAADAHWARGSDGQNPRKQEQLRDVPPQFDAIERITTNTSSEEQNVRLRYSCRLVAPGVVLRHSHCSLICALYFLASAFPWQSPCNCILQQHLASQRTTD